MQHRYRPAKHPVWESMFVLFKTLYRVVVFNGFFFVCCAVSISLFCRWRSSSSSLLLPPPPFSCANGITRNIFKWMLQRYERWTMNVKQPSYIHTSHSCSLCKMLTLFYILVSDYLLPIKVEAKCMTTITYVVAFQRRG